MADPLTHSATTAGYHGTAFPPGIQLAMGKNPRTTAGNANATASHRETDGRVEMRVEMSSVATRETLLDRRHPTRRPANQRVRAGVNRRDTGGDCV